MAPLILKYVSIVALASQISQSRIILSSGAGRLASHTLELCGRGISDASRFQSSGTCPVPVDETAGSDPSSWAPWTHAPYCTDNGYCVFTNARFRNNLGISVVTTPENIASVSNLVGLLSSSPPSREPVPPSYVIKPIPDKGIGVVAARDIQRGEIIMSEPVTILADFDLPKKLEHSDGVMLFGRGFSQLSDPDRAWTLAKSSEHLLAPASEDIMRTNAFGVALNDVDRMAIFPNISVRTPSRPDRKTTKLINVYSKRVNHGCDPK